MDWAEDLKVKVKSGLRKNKQPSEERKDDLFNIEEISSTKDEPGQPRSRRFDGWASEVPKSSKTKAIPNIIEQERFLATTEIKAQSPEEEIPTIPDLDDMHEDMLLNEMAPNHSISMKMTYKNLVDSEISKSFGALEDVDLSLLVRCLQTDVPDEPDIAWDWGNLFTQISAEIAATSCLDTETTYLK